ncbi:MAG: hypothetical protein GY701_31670 [Sulfitobacter sp.]|nr:hypothetical protein [Sulfitobacter sp.]
MRVPSHYVSSFLFLRDLSGDEYDRLLAALDSASPTISVSGMAEGLAGPSEQSVDDLVGLVNALASLGGLRRVQGLTPELVAERVAGSEDLDTPESDQAMLAERIQATSDTRAIRLLSKAIDLGSEHDKVFVGARVLTDLRPIFGEEADGGPEGAILSHALKFEFVHDEGHLGNFYVVLDDEDLEVLSGAIDRATQKAASLKELLQRAGLTYMGLES